MPLKDQLYGEADQGNVDIVLRVRSCAFRIQIMTIESPGKAVDIWLGGFMVMTPVTASPESLKSRAMDAKVVRIQGGKSQELVQ